MLRHEVEPEPRRAVGRALGSGKHDDRRAVDVRAEPLLTVDEDATVTEVAGRAVDSSAEIGATVALGEEHRSVEPGLERVGAQAGQQRVAHVGRRVGGDEPGDARGHAEAAHESGVGLREQVARGRVDDAGHRPTSLGLVAGEAARVPALPERPLRVEVGRMVHDLVDLVRPAVVADQLRRVGVDQIGVGSHPRAHQLAEGVELRLGPLEILGWAVAPHTGPEVGIELVPVLAGRAVERGVVDHRGSSGSVRGYAQSLRLP